MPDFGAPVELLEHMISTLPSYLTLILSFTIFVLPSIKASERIVVTLDPQTNAALLRYRYRIETSLTTGAMEAATQELNATLGVTPDEETGKKAKSKKRLARTSFSDSS